MTVEDLELEINAYEKYLSPGISRKDFEKVLKYVISKNYWLTLGPDKLLVFLYNCENDVFKFDSYGEKMKKDIVAFLVITNLARVFTSSYINGDFVFKTHNEREIIIVISDELNYYDSSKWYHSPNLKEIVCKNAKYLYEEYSMYEFEHLKDYSEEEVLDDLKEIE